MESAGEGEKLRVDKYKEKETALSYLRKKPLGRKK